MQPASQSPVLVLHLHSIYSENFWPKKLIGGWQSKMYYIVFFKIKRIKNLGKTIWNAISSRSLQYV